jgi:hypothetical protein
MRIGLREKPVSPSRMWGRGHCPAAGRRCFPEAGRRRSQPAGREVARAARRTTAAAERARSEEHGLRHQDRLGEA